MSREDGERTQFRETEELQHRLAQRLAAHRSALHDDTPALGTRMSSEPMTAIDITIPPQLYHGTRADLKPGDLIAPGYSSDYGERKQASWVYLTGPLDAAVWGAELAAGEGSGRIYVVEEPV